LAYIDYIEDIPDISERRYKDILPHLLLHIEDMQSINKRIEKHQADNQSDKDKIVEHSEYKQIENRVL
jgi:tetrahydromethanopterin S-methyltransferase subunit A